MGDRRKEKETEMAERLGLAKLGGTVNDNIVLTEEQKALLARTDYRQTEYSKNYREHYFGTDWLSIGGAATGLGVTGFGVATAFGVGGIAAAPVTGAVVAIGGLYLGGKQLVQVVSGFNRKEVKHKTFNTMLNASEVLEASGAYDGGYISFDDYIEQNRRMQKETAGLLGKFREAPIRYKNLVKWANGKTSGPLRDKYYGNMWDDISTEQQMLILQLTDQVQNAMDDDFYIKELKYMNHEYFLNYRTDDYSDYLENTGNNDKTDKMGEMGEAYLEYLEEERKEKEKREAEEKAKDRLDKDAEDSSAPIPYSPMDYDPPESQQGSGVSGGYTPKNFRDADNASVSALAPTSHYSPGASGANQNKTLPIPPKYAKLLRQHEVEKAKADRMQHHGKTIMDNPEVRKFYQQPSTPTKKVSVSVRSTPSQARIRSLAKAVDRRIARYL